MSLPVLQPGHARPASQGSPLGHPSSPGGRAKPGLLAVQQRSMPDLTMGLQAETQVLSPMATSSQRSMPELMKLQQAEKLARNRQMMTELRKLGLMGLPSCQRMRSSITRESLLRARTLGELRALRNALRAAGSHLGVDDPLVKQVRKVLAEADRCAASCKECITLESLRVLPSIMFKIEHILFHVKQLGLGSGLWEDPYLGSARRKLAAWKEHRETLEHMVAKLQEGPTSYCDAWVQLAVENCALLPEFGCAVTKELLSLPYVATELVKSLVKMFEKLPDTPEEPVDVRIEAIMSISKALSHLDREQLDDLMLKGTSESRTSTLQVVIDQQNIWVFSALYQALAGEIVEIPRELQKQLDRDPQMALQQPFEFLAPKLGELLHLDPEHLCLRTSPAEGLTLRLLVSAGQPSAQYCQQVLGGSSVEPLRRTALYVEELSKWSEAGERIKDLYDLRRNCCRTREVAVAAEADVVKAIARVEAAEVRANDAKSEAEAAGARWFEAKSVIQDKWSEFCACMKEVRDTMERPSSTEADVKAAKAREADAETEHKAAKERAAQRGEEAEEAARAAGEARDVAAKQAAAAEVTRETFLRSSAEAAAAVSRYQAYLHTPLSSSVIDSPPSQKAKSSSRSHRSTQRQQGKQGMRQREHANH